MSIKDDLLKKISQRAEKIRQDRASAKNRKDIDRIVFDFFKEAEEMSKMGREMADEVQANSGDVTAHVLILGAGVQLQEQIRARIDRDARVEVVMKDGTSQVNGVLITWSKFYQVANKCDETLYIGIEHMLFKDY